MVKASIRKPVSAAPLGKPAPIIDVEEINTKHAVDETSAAQLATELENGAEPGSTATSDYDKSTSRGVVTRPVQPVGSYSEKSNGGIEGDFDSGDFKLPQFKIVNGSGPLSQKYNQGTLLYADEALWLPPDLREGAKNPIMNIVPLKISKQFRENLTQDEVEEGLMPRIANSRLEAEAMGGSTQWLNNEKPRWSPSARVVLLMQEPEGCNHPGFNTPLDGKNWGLAVYYASGTGYGESAKVIFNAAQVSLKEAGRIVLHSRVWTLQITKKKSGNFMVFVPSLKLTKEITGPEVREQAERVCGGHTSDAGE